MHFESSSVLLVDTVTLSLQTPPLASMFLPVPEEKFEIRKKLALSAAEAENSGSGNEAENYENNDEA